ncbi:hypothetical protein [Brevibacillus choshinensis]|nr:hypothetical protein [Brevibacillus choshinensis]
MTDLRASVDTYSASSKLGNEGLPIQTGVQIERQFFVLFFTIN